ncbi:prolyl 4-hydroxylase subunit alpha-2-like [Drosophila ficusphila]|uniref:prolyl 4-hydroxylase subunit alpha-2-like n=1 Tax=Drosophila ficusphila TaxID=30025 RepID=UPI001C8A91EC|nr:prolyl 4-hydroxylase subunit alpha-2-like [Drosophila ficusphila]
MDDLLKMEGELVANLESYAAVLTNKAETIRRGVLQMKEMHQRMKKEKLKEFRALHSYSLIRYMQADWLMWSQYLEHSSYAEHLAFVESKKQFLPKEHDFADAANGIRRMQATYGMLASDISNGLLDGVQYNSFLASVDCLAMGRHLMNQNRWTSAEQWILAGINAEDRKGFQTEMQMLRGPNIAELFRALGKVRIKMNEPKEALEAYKKALKYSPHDIQIFEEYQALTRTLLTSSGSESIKEEPDDDIEEMQLPPCCSGRYPFVVVFHEMVYPKESALIRSSSKELLTPSETIDNDTTDFVVASSRTSKSVWFDDDANEATLKLANRLGDATGLDMKHSEPFQVINYGIGGFFETHWDLLHSDENRFTFGSIDRMATTLFYLNDVPQGGGTYFPGLNLTVFPKFGSVLFWYNLDTKGNNLLRTMHTGCPVIVGSKWVVSKWIDDKGQEFRRSCIDIKANSKHSLSVEKLF